MEVISTTESESESELEDIVMVSGAGVDWMEGGFGLEDGGLEAGFVVVAVETDGPSTSITSSSEISTGGLVLRELAVVVVLDLVTFDGP